MRKIIVSILFSIFLLAQPPDTLWTRTYGGAGFDVGFSVVEAYDGGYIVAGLTQSFGAAVYDIFAMKLDSNGDSVWVKTYGGDDYESGGRIAKTFDSCYVIIGATRSYGGGQPNTDNVFIIKIDSAGDTVWTKVYGGEYYDGGMQIAESENADLIAAGYSDNDIYIIKMLANGDTLWTRTFGLQEPDCANDIHSVPNGYIFAGYSQSYGAGDKDIYVAKINEGGDVIWKRVFGDEAYDIASSVTYAENGGFLIAGTTTSFGAGSSDIYALSVDSLGDTLWTRTYGGNLTEFASDIIRTYDSCYVITGYTYSYGAGLADLYLIKIDRFGDTLWTCTYGDTSVDIGRMILATSDNGYLIVGEKGYDIFIMKTVPDTLACHENSNQDHILNNLILSPNPNSGIVHVKYLLFENSYVGISIIDILGKKREKLWYDHQDAGIHQTKIDLRHIPQGIYFVQLQTKNRSEIKPVIIIK